MFFPLRMIACRPNQRRTSFSCRSSLFPLQPIRDPCRRIGWGRPRQGGTGNRTGASADRLTIIQCFYGADEEYSACPSLLGKAEVIRTSGGHHFPPLPPPPPSPPPPKAPEFRADLFFRLNGFPITLPPLRERREDILPLAAHFIRKICAREGKAIAVCSGSGTGSAAGLRWPGNIRELENVIERNVILTKSGNKIDLPFETDRR